MKEHKLLKKLSISIASIALICPLALGGVSGSTVANAKRTARTYKAYRHHRRARRHTRRNHKHSYGYIPARYHESNATWYKNNAVRLYHRYRHNHAFKDGYKNGHHGFEDSTSAYITREYAYSNKYKYGWIIGSTRMDVDPDNYFSARYDLKSALKFHYRAALNFWNGGIHYLNRHPNAHATEYNANYWVNDDED